jgi:hypothetical protein
MVPGSVQLGTLGGEPDPLEVQVERTRRAGKTRWGHHRQASLERLTTDLVAPGRGCPSGEPPPHVSPGSQLPTFCFSSFSSVALPLPVRGSRRTR